MRARVEGRFLLSCLLLSLLDAGVVFGQAALHLERLVASGNADNHQFGVDVDLDAGTIAAGAWGQGSVGSFAYVFAPFASPWHETARLGQQAVQSVALRGHALAAGQPNDASLQGSVVVFRKLGSTWFSEATLVDAGGAPAHRLGWSVDMSGDTLVAGAPFVTDLHGPPGRACVFVKSPAGWVQEATLTGSMSSTGNWMGASVAIDGDTVVVGAPWDDTTVGESGAAYVYVRSGTTWTEQARLVSPDPQQWGRFGGSVDVSGETIVVGAEWEGYGIHGAIHVFVRSGSSWTLSQTLVPRTWKPYTSLGTAVALDGDRLVATGVDGANYVNSAAYDFFRSAGEGFVEQTTFVPLEGDLGTFGRSIDLEGRLVVVGVPEDSWTEVYGGSVHVFHLSAAGCDSLTIDPATLPDARVGTPYVQSLTVTGAEPPAPFRLLHGQLPPGLSLAPTGDILGTPTAAGAHDFTVAVTDADGCHQLRSYVLTVDPASVLRP